MNKYKDLNLDLSANSFTKDISTVSDNRSISQSLTNILLSRVGERPFSSSDAGVGLEGLFFTLSSPRSAEFLNLKQTANEKINLSYEIKGTNKIDNLTLVVRGN
mgnify:CR=1 FL=1